MTASRLVGYKRVKLIAEAFAAMPDRSIDIIGDGEDFAAIHAIAKSSPNIHVHGHVSHRQLVQTMRSAKAFVFASEEDFGIAPVEAMACGTPVIAFERGGAGESVLNGVTGFLFPEQSIAALQAALEAFEAAPAIDPQVCRDRALGVFLPINSVHSFRPLWRRRVHNERADKCRPYWQPISSFGVAAVLFSWWLKYLQDPNACRS